MGWKCLYAPYAKGYHVRKALPGNRRALPAEINMHSVKNRFLLRMKNITLGSLPAQLLLHHSARYGGARLLSASGSTPRCGPFPFLFKNWKSVMDKRREIHEQPARG